MHAFTDFRDVLAETVSSAMPELKSDVERVVEYTGGRKKEGSEQHRGQEKQRGDGAGGGGGGAIGGGGT